MANDFKLHLVCFTNVWNCATRLQPEASVFLDVPVRHGDVIVALTDGVLDNVFTKEIRQVRKNLPMNFTAHKCLVAPQPPSGVPVSGQGAPPK